MIQYNLERNVFLLFYVDYTLEQLWVRRKRNEASGGAAGREERSGKDNPEERMIYVSSSLLWIHLKHKPNTTMSQQEPWKNN